MAYIYILVAKMIIYLVTKVQISSLLVQKVTILAKYFDFAEVFSKELAKIFPKKTGSNKFAIKLKKRKQQPYKLIYNLELVKLGILETYIKTNLINGFIRVSKLLVCAIILFV